MGTDCFHRRELPGAKRSAPLSFFRFTKNEIDSVKAEDVWAGQAEMERRHKPVTVE